MSRGWAITPTHDYPPDWPALAARVKAEAGDRCVRCGHPSGDVFLGFIGKSLRPCTEHCMHPADGKLRILTVHHLNGDKADSRWWNLLALCQVCHLTIQARVMPERPWLFDHTPWFVPYACGFYASYYGGLEITRAQALAAPARYLAMGQPWAYGVITEGGGL